MNLVLEREQSSATATIGGLYAEGFWECFTLELPWRDNQHDVSCIPEGTYPVVITFSPHLGFETPELQNVPNRGGIRIHPANFTSEILGCIAVGDQRQGETVLHSKDAFGTLMLKIRTAIQNGEPITLRIENKREIS